MKQVGIIQPVPCEMDKGTPYPGVGEECADTEAPRLSEPLPLQITDEAHNINLKRESLNPHIRVSPDH